MGNETRQIPRLLLVQVVSSLDKDDTTEEMPELTALVQTFGGQILAKETQYRNHPDPATYIGKGKVKWLKEMVEAHDIDVVVLNDIAKSSQLFRLEKELWEVNRLIQVWDKVDLILHIFEQHAQTTEAKLQIELAKLQHGGPRIYGLGGTVLSRQGGGIGTRGLGETNIELEKRQMSKRIQTIREELKKRAGLLKKRIDRRAKRGVFTAALVGYTSAGKTTLFNTLTQKEKQTSAGLFTTLDSIVGKIRFERTPPVLVSDTIGFIDDLPPQLIEAFTSTLQESLQSRLLLIVVDAADPKLDAKLKVVEDILDELQTPGKRVLILNKIDRLPDEQRYQLTQQFAKRQSFFVSAQTGEGIGELKQYLQHAVLQGA